MAKNKIFSSFGILCIRLYQRGISPFIGGKCACRYSPTCSEYTKIAIEKYGFFRGICLGIKEFAVVGLAVGMVMTLCLDIRFLCGKIYINNVVKIQIKDFKL